MLEKKERQRTSLSAPADLSNIVQPTTLNVIGASVQTAFFGTGTRFADLEAAAVEERKKTGTPMSKENFDNVYGRQYKNLKWTEGMTQEAAAVLSAYEDQQRDYESVLSRASNLQSAAAFVPTFAAAMIETKNAGIELGVQAGVSAVAFAASKANPITAAYLPVKALAATHKILTGAKVSARTKFAYGAGLGVVSAGIAEPSNISSAETLQQDYDYVDTLMNIASSSMLGGAIEAAPTWARSLRQKFGSKAFDVHAAKMDTAAAQMAEGQPIDLSYPEAAAKISMANVRAPVNEKINAIQNFVAEKTGKDIFPSQPDLKQNPDIFLEQIDGLPGKESQGGQIARDNNLPPNAKKQLTNPSEYVVRNRETGETIFKTQDKTLLSNVNRDKYETVPLAEHLLNLDGKSFDLTERSLLQAEKVRALHEQTAFTGLKSGDDVLKKIVNDNTEIINSVEQFGVKKLSLETPEPEPEYESFDDIYRQAQQFKTDHDNIMRMIEAGEVDTISAAAYKAELAGLDPDSLDNGFLELQNCLLGI
jgi:hypothetical protein